MDTEAKDSFQLNEDIVNEGEESITPEDYLTSLNKEILLGLKYSEDKRIQQCTYDQGNKTQELFACLTCFKNTNKRAALCIACSVNCHKDHEIIHLYFKRNYRCDCGNENFSKFKFFNYIFLSKCLYIK